MSCWPRRANAKAQELQVERVAPIVAPRHLLVSVASVLIALALPRADTERQLFSLESSDLISRDLLESEPVESSDELETDPALELQPMVIEEQENSTRLAQLLDVELELSALSDELAEGSGEGSDRELSDAELAAIEDALLQEQLSGESPTDASPGLEAQRDGLQELAREGGEDAPMDGTDPQHAGAKVRRAAKDKPRLASKLATPISRARSKRSKCRHHLAPRCSVRATRLRPTPLSMLLPRTANRCQEPRQSASRVRRQPAARPAARKGSGGALGALKNQR